MSIDITNPGVAGITVESDPTALKLTGGTLSGTLYLPTARNLLNADLNIVAYNDTGAGTTYTHSFKPFDGTFQLATNGGGLRFPNGTVQTTAGLPLTGGTVTGKVNFTSVAGNSGVNIGVGGTSTTSTTAGDLWISTGGSSLNFRDGTGAWRVLASLSGANIFTTNQVIAAASSGALLRVTQTGTGNALVVEDTNNPDGSAFIIDQHGKVGIGVAPHTTACLHVDGNGILFNSQQTLSNVYADAAPTVPSGFNADSPPVVIKFTIDGVEYGVPAFQY